MNPYALRRRNLKPDVHALDGDTTPEIADLASGAPPPSAIAAGLLPYRAAAWDPVEEALAQALIAAATAGRFDVVAKLAGDLEARRLARAGVPTLADERARRRTTL